MQYVRSISGSVSKTWNSINPATLSGAIDVIVVEHEDGTLACSPFHVRFGKFSLLRPHEKKVDFRVNDHKQEFPMKLGEGGEAFFVFETTNSIPEALQTSPLVSPATSPEIRPSTPSAPALAEPDSFDLEGRGDSPSKKSSGRDQPRSENGIPIAYGDRRTHSDRAAPSSRPGSGDKDAKHTASTAWSETPTTHAQLHRAVTDHALPANRFALGQSFESSDAFSRATQRPRSPMRPQTDRSTSPSALTNEEAMTRAINLSKKLWGSNIPSQVTDRGDLMLDMTGYKSSDDEALRAEVIARKILSEELEGNYDIGSLIGADEKGNLWIYSSEEAKEQAGRKIADGFNALQPLANNSSDALSDPGYHSDDARSESDLEVRPRHIRQDSDSAVGMSSPPESPGAQTAGDPNRNYAKTLRLTSDQLKTLDLKPGQNTMSFSVNRATCTASLYLWRHDVPIVISDIDGTITKSDALGHVLNMIGRDWTHLGVAKLYTDIAANGYNLLYLTSRSVGQADTTRTYLAGVVQEGGFKLPKGPVIMSPDRTIAALRREIYLRKPEVFKMACLRDIMALFSGAAGNMFVDPNPSNEDDQQQSQPQARKGGSPFYAGFGNRLTDALSYRSVNIPSTRIFTINSSAEVSLDLLTLNKYKTGYSSMREIVDHFFPPVGLLVKGGGEEFTDFNYWRDKPLAIGDFSGSESEDNDDDDDDDDDDQEDEDEDEEDGDYDDRYPDGMSSPALSRRGRGDLRSGLMSEDEGGMGESFLSEAVTRRSFDTAAEETREMEESGILKTNIEEGGNDKAGDEGDDEEETELAGKIKDADGGFEGYINPTREHEIELAVQDLQRPPRDQR